MLRFLRLSHYCVRKLLQSHSDLLLRSPPKSILPTWVGVSKDGAALPPCMVRDALRRAALLTMRPGGFRAPDTVALRPSRHQPLPVHISCGPRIERRIVGRKLLSVRIDPDRGGACGLLD